MGILRHCLEGVHHVLRHGVILRENLAKLIELRCRCALTGNEQPERLFRRDVGELEDRNVANAQTFIGRHAGRIADEGRYATHAAEHLLDGYAAKDGLAVFFEKGSTLGTQSFCLDGQLVVKDAHKGCLRGYSMQNYERK